MKLTLNKRTWLITGLVIFVLALGALGMVGFQRFDEKSKLEKQLTKSQALLQGIRLESLSSQPAELENQLRQITPEFEAVKAKLSQPISSTAAATALFGTANDHGMVVTEMTSSSPTDESVEGVTLSAMSMTAKVEGKVSKMVDFITALNKILKTSAVTSVEIAVPETTNGDNATVSIELVVYTYRGE